MHEQNLQRSAENRHDIKKSGVTTWKQRKNKYLRQS